MFCPVQISAVHNQVACYWLASVFAYGVLQTTARGRDEQAAIAAAVAQFRSSRAARHAA